MSFSASFRSLDNPVYRRYFIGTALTRTGNWTQDVAQSWFVFEQTGSGTAVGALLACEFVPILALSLWAGSLVDRHSRRMLLIVTQGAFVLLALALAGVAALDGPLALLFVIAALRGIVGAVNIVAGSAFIAEIVPKEHMRSASSLNGMLFNVGRIVGALLAALLVQITSMSVCFLVNALAYVVLLVMMLGMHPDHINAAPPQSKAGILDGLRYAWQVRELRAAIVVMFGVGLFAYNSQVFFPMMADEVFNAGINTYAWLLALYSAGFIISSIVGAAGDAPTNAMMLRSAAALGVMFVLAAAFAGVPVFGLLVVVCWGGANGMFGSRVNTVVQLNSSPEMKGRVMAVWTIVVWGTTPLGAPLVGFIGEQFGVRVSLLVTAFAIFACSAYALSVLRHRLAHVS